MEFFIAFIIWGLICLGVAALAGSRGRSSFGFFLLSFVFSPLLGLIVVLVMSNLIEETAREAERRINDERREIDRKRDHEKQLESLRAVTASHPTRNPVQANEAAVNGSIADELNKLAALQERGILTFSEFDIQKSRLLGSSVNAIFSPPNESLSAIRIPANADLSESDSCKAALITAGCKVFSPSENMWEILDPSGVTRVIRSADDLKQLAQRYQTS
jgi:hypothetical protein